MISLSVYHIPGSICVEDPPSLVKCFIIPVDPSAMIHYYPQATAARSCSPEAGDHFRPLNLNMSSQRISLCSPVSACVLDGHSGHGASHASLCLPCRQDSGIVPGPGLAKGQAVAFAECALK